MTNMAYLFIESGKRSWHGTPRCAPLIYALSKNGIPTEAMAAGCTQEQNDIYGRKKLAARWWLNAVLSNCNLCSNFIFISK